MPQKITRQTQSAEVYTAAEQDTGKIWVDGRTIYRKVLRGQFTIASGSNNIVHGVSGMTSSLELVSMQGGLKIGAGGVTGGQEQSLWYRETGGNWINFVSIDATNMLFTSSFAWGNSYYSIIMEYVK